MTKEILVRKDVDEKLTWDLTAIFKTEEEFEQAVKEAEELTDEIEKEYKGKLNSSNAINNCLDKLRSLYQLINLTCSYMHI